MAKQNIYDNETFFEGYKRIRENEANGVFVFSQENPINTCFSGGDRWTRDDNGRKLHVNLANYSVEGERESRWFVDGVKKYHKPDFLLIKARK